MYYYIDKNFIFSSKLCKQALNIFMLKHHYSTLYSTSKKVYYIEYPFRSQIKRH